MKFNALTQKNICDILIGDKICGTYRNINVAMPYKKGYELCEISTYFGLKTQYPQDGGAPSRWIYMQNLINYSIEHNITEVVIGYFFQPKFFMQDLYKNSSSNTIKQDYECMTSIIINEINKLLTFSDIIIQLHEEKIAIIPRDKTPSAMRKALNKIPSQYIKELHERIKNDINSGNYDSVVTKSRTLIEEVLLFILDEKKIHIDKDGRILKYSGAVKKALNMNQTGDKDKRINALLSGLEKIIQSIIEFKNSYSDAHGVGTNRINLRIDEALLIVNCTVTYCEYIYSIYLNNKSKEYHS